MRVCTVCGATWIDGQHYWKTGKLGDPHDLAGLVCNTHFDKDCINPCIGSTSGQTWEIRKQLLDNSGEEYYNQSVVT